MNVYRNSCNLWEYVNKLKTTSLETLPGKVDQILGNEKNNELWKA